MTMCHLNKDPIINPSLRYKEIEYLHAITICNQKKKKDLSLQIQKCQSVSTIKNQRKSCIMRCIQYTKKDTYKKEYVNNNNPIRNMYRSRKKKLRLKLITRHQDRAKDNLRHSRISLQRCKK